ncbi:hypothetical protein PHYC_01223 [Phycisphaerales bacterium]|nr:hypothetical protein PHYC_01223 [Phycisphaerales bacterium]
MAEAQSAGQKTCTVCGLDVAGKPRVKDAQGRYMCQDCFNKARAARGAQNAPKIAAQAAKPLSPPPDESDNSFLLDIGKKGSVSERGVAPCPECGRALEEGTVVCVGCGYNSKTGKRLQVKVLKPEVDKSSGAKVTSPGSSLASNPHVIGVAVAIMWGGFAGAVVAAPDLYLVYVIAYLLYTLVVGICIIVQIWSESPMAGGILIALRVGGRSVAGMAGRSGDENAPMIAVGIELALLLVTLAIVLTKVESIVLRWLWCAGILAGILGAVVNPDVLKQF